jgi:hypothetical protein
MTLRRRMIAGTTGFFVAALAAGCSSAASSSSSSVPGATASASASPASASSPATAPTAAPAAAAPGAGASSSAAATASAAASGSAGSSSPAGSSSSAGSSGAATPRAAGAPACPTRSLKASAGSAQGAAGSVYQPIDFTNISTTACTLYGYPGMALAGGSPVAQIGAAATRSTATAAKLVTLAPGQTAYALLRVTDALNYPTSTCHPVTSAYLQIYPPNQTTPIYLPDKTTACASTSVKQLSVSVVQPGSGG